MAVDEASGTASVLAQGAQKLLALPVDEDRAVSDYSMFELVEKLRLGGWECLVARGKNMQNLVKFLAQWVLFG